MWSMLFGLLMWDCLFADVPDTLRTQFQLCPLDLSTPHFYEVKALSSETLTCAMPHCCAWMQQSFPVNQYATTPLG